MRVRDEVRRKDGAVLYKNHVGCVRRLAVWDDGRDMAAVDDQSGGVTWHMVEDLVILRTTTGEGMSTTWAVV